MGHKENGQPQDLVRLRRRLDEFRRGSSPGKALPGWAWSEAGRLARRHGVHRTARALGLEYNKLKRTSGAGPVAASAGRTVKQSPARGGAVKFLELPNPLPAVGQMCRVRLAGPAGECLELEMSPGAAKGLKVMCRLDRRKYSTGRKVSAAEMKQIKLRRDKFHGEWNYSIAPRTQT